MQQKNRSILTPFVEKLTSILGSSHFKDLCDPSLRHVLDLEKQRLKKLEMIVIPETLQEFRNSSHYCIPSQLKKYQGFVPQATPLAN